MKRQSKAEEAINKQIKIIDLTIENNRLEIDMIEARNAALLNLKSNMENQISFLTQQRVTASVTRKP